MSFRGTILDAGVFLKSGNFVKGSSTMNTSHPINRYYNAERGSNSYAILVKNLQNLMTEIYKSLINMNSWILLEFHANNV